MNIYVLIETADIEILGVHVRASREHADEIFDLLAVENRVHEWDADDLKKEANGAIRGAGDDSYAVEMFEQEVGSFDFTIVDAVVRNVNGPTTPKELVLDTQFKDEDDSGKIGRASCRERVYVLV